MSENMTPGGHLSGPQRKALDALATGATTAQAAALAGRHERTVNRWINDDPAFRSALDIIADDGLDRASRRLSVMLDDALDALAGLLKTRDQAVRLRAVQTVIDAKLRIRDARDMDRRLRAIEEKLGL